jgi:hypothetical protein
MNQRERHTPDGGSDRTAPPPPPPAPARAEGGAGSLWEDWYHRASPAQRQDLLALAAAQGVLYAHQLPAPQDAAQRAHPGDGAPLPLLSALLAGHLRDLPAFQLPELAPDDPALDDAQRRAAARAVHSPDVCLIQGHPGTGKSRVVAEVIRQSASRGQRVLLLAPAPAALDAVLERLAPHDGVCAVRCLAPDEPAEGLPACVRRMTLPERCRFFRDHTVPAARSAARDAHQLCAARSRDESVWASLEGLFRRHDQLRAEMQAFAARRDALPDAVRAELTAPGLPPSPTRQAYADSARARDEVLARLDARAADARAQSDKVKAELAGLCAERDRLRPFAEARQAGRWWSVRWWRATVFQRHLLTSSKEVERRVGELGQGRDRLEQEAAALAEERRRAEQRFREETDRLCQAETARRLAEEDTRLRALEAERGLLAEEWHGLCRQLSPGAPAPHELTAEAFGAARAEWVALRDRDAQHAEALRQWADAVESALPALPRRLAACANVVAATAGAPPEEDLFGEPVFDLLILEEAHRFTESEFLALARRARRWVLVGEPVPDEPRPAAGKPTRPGPLRPGFFQRLWQQLHADPRRLPYRWAQRDGKLTCTLRPLGPDYRRWVESEPVADRPDVELRIVSPPRQTPYVAEVTFPASTPLPEAREFIFRELDELAVEAPGPGARWVETPEEVRLELSDAAGADGVVVVLPGGVRERLAPRAGTPGPGAVPWQTSSLQFDRAAGWDRAAAERWVEERLGLRDRGRTALLAVHHRTCPPLASFLAGLLPGTSPARGTSVGDPLRAFAESAPVQFIPVPPLDRAGPRRHSEPEPRWRGGGTAVAPRLRAARGGAGLEVDLADHRRVQQLLPTELRPLLPAQGLVNYLEARAVVAALEALVTEPGFQRLSADWQHRRATRCRMPGCVCGPGGVAAGGCPAVAVMALYPAQAELIRLLVRRSPALASAGVSVEVGLPSTFRQRECLVGLVSLTRSHSHRAVSYGEHPQALLEAFTRPVARLVLLGDPGTLARRSQWQGPLDHLDEPTARCEQALVTQLVHYLQGDGPHPDTFHLLESGA